VCVCVWRNTDGTFARLELVLLRYKQNSHFNKALAVERLGSY